MKTRKPSFDYEKQFWGKGSTVFGIDEVGRGSFAGPLVGAAVAFEKNHKQKWLKDINDSKLLTHKQRKLLSKKIQKNAKYFIEIIDIETIDKIGIGKSNSLLFKRLIDTVSKQHKNVHFLLDGRKNIRKSNAKFIIKGDRLSISIAAASIVAKVFRDNLMQNLGKEFRGYNLAKNKGYGTKFHREALKIHGLSPVHRKSFNLRRFYS